MTDIPTIQLECKKDGLQQLQSGTWKLSLTVNGEDMEKAIGTLGKAPMGTIYMVVLAEVGDDGQPRARAKEEDGKKRKDPTESQRCAMLCQDGEFQEWLFNNYRRQWDDTPFNCTVVEMAALTVKAIIGADSRKVLDSDPEGEPSQRWLRLKAEYEEYAGRIPERTR